jgi:Type II secretion system (T2SS), protein G
MLKTLLSKVWLSLTFLPKTLLTLALNLIGTIPAYDLTVTRIGLIEIRIRSHWDAHGELPEHLSNLPILQGRDNAVIDGWGKPIQYSVTGTTVRLSSFGADGIVGGEGLNQDIIVTFDASQTIDR